MPASELDTTGLMDGITLRESDNTDIHVGRPANGEPPLGDTPPPTDPPIPGTPPPDGTPPPPPQVAKYAINEIFGDDFPYKTPEEIKALRISEQLAEVPTLRESLTKTTETLTALQGKAKVLDSPHFNSAAKFASFVDATGIQDYSIFQRISNMELDKLDDIDALVFKEVCDMPDELPNMHSIKMDYRKKFKLGEFADEVPDPNDPEKTIKVENDSDKRNLKREALSAKKYLSELKGKVNDFKLDIQDTTVDREKNKADWTPAIPKLLPYFKQLQIPLKEIEIPTQKGKVKIPIDVSYQITPDDQKIIEGMMSKYVQDGNIPLTEDGIKHMYYNVLSDFKDMKDVERFRLFGEKIFALAEMEVKKTVSNWSWDQNPPDRNVPNITLPEGGKTADQIFEMQKAQGY